MFNDIRISKLLILGSRLLTSIRIWLSDENYSTISIFFIFRTYWKCYISSMFIFDELSLKIFLIAYKCQAFSVYNNFIFIII